MSMVRIEVGRRIRSFRKMRGYTLAQLSGMVHRGISTLSKYETGEISVDIETLYDLAEALQVRVEDLLYCPPGREPRGIEESPTPAFFSGLTRFYSYFFDGRTNSLIRCAFDLQSPDTGEVMMYMNFRDYEFCQKCENTYRGTIEHYNAITNILLTNRDTPMEKARVQILASYLDSETKWGLWTGLSSRPMMPVAAKMLFSKNRITENSDLISELRISKADIRLLKLYNMLSVT